MIEILLFVILLVLIFMLFCLSDTYGVLTRILDELKSKPWD